VRRRLGDPTGRGTFKSLVVPPVCGAYPNVTHEIQNFESVRRSSTGRKKERRARWRS
jgi:hypothetical protein